MKFSGSNYYEFNNKNPHTRSKSHSGLRVRNSNNKQSSRQGDNYLNVSYNKTILKYISQKLDGNNEDINNNYLESPEETSNYFISQPIPVIKNRINRNVYLNNEKCYVDPQNDKINNDLVFLRAENLKLNAILESTKEEYFSLYQQMEKLKEELNIMNNKKNIKKSLCQQYQTKGNSINKNNSDTSNRNKLSKKDFNFTSTINSLSISEDEDE